MDHSGITQGTKRDESTMKLTKLSLDRQFDLALLFTVHKVQAFSCTRAAAEAEGINNVFCGFADPTNRYIVLIEDDCTTLSNESIRVILCHELAHILVPSISEEQADEFASRFTNLAAVRKAREETEQMRLRIKNRRVHKNGGEI